MLISESYKKRLKELAGIFILSEATDEEERIAAFSLSNQRIPYNKDLMIQAINEGREVGILFQSNNEKYKMPTSKYRTIYPVAIGTSKAGNEVLRAVHKIGQSESAARKIRKRSAEVKDEWRMFKVSNIKSMWFTGKFFDVPPKHYNAADKGMVNVEVAADFAKIKQFQLQLANQMKQQTKPKPQIVSLFKEPENKNLQPEPEQTDAVTEPKPKTPKSTLKGTVSPLKTIPIKNKKDRQ